MSSTNRGYDRHKSDYYITPIKEIEKFLDEFIALSPSINTCGYKINALDPCAGGDENNPMSYVEAFSKCTSRYDKITTIDIREDSLADIKGDYLKINCKNKYNMIIMNPPFNQAIEFLQKALNDVQNDGYVIMLQRINFMGSKARYKFFQENMFKYMFVHSKRLSFTDNGKTDSIEYAHFVWHKDANGKTNSNYQIIEVLDYE